ncbi:MAG TPA: hypothetical protein VKZ67_00510 [Natronosporangium sp.]|nr:hypothetical protein [Natronosporangium sp.]
MAITLTYLDDLARVQITATDLAASEVRVERSVDGAPWETVRGGVAAIPDSGAIELDDYEFGSDVGNEYRVVDTGDDSVLETDSITPSLGGRVWLKNVRYPLVNRRLWRVLDRGQSISRPARGEVFPIVGRSVPVAQTDLRDSKRFTLDFQAQDEEEAGAIDLSLAVGGVLFIHVPPGCPVQGGYVVADTTAQARQATVERWVFTLPCTIVAPPGPDVTPTTLTWGTVERLYGSWTALLAAHPTWKSLRSLVGLPEDLEEP